MNNTLNKEYTFALLIDSDNLSTDYYDIIINEIEELGQIRYKRIYGNFIPTNPWSQYAMQKGITPIQAFVPVKGKNATDMVMAIDCMDLFYSDTVDAFCLATSDSDFSRLAQRLKEGGKYVVIAGKEQSPEALNNSCHKFIMLDRLYEISKESKILREAEKETSESKRNTKPNKPQEEKSSDEKTVSVPKLSEIKEVVKEIINERAHDGWAYYAEVIPQIEKRYPQFNYKIYGVSNKQDFFKNKIGCEMKTEDTSVMIKLK